MSAVFYLLVTWAVVALGYTSFLVWKSKQQGALPEGFSLPQFIIAYAKVFFAFPPFVVGVLLAAVGILVAAGPKDAVEFLDEQLWNLGA